MKVIHYLLSGLLALGMVCNAFDLHASGTQNNSQNRTVRPLLIEGGKKVFPHEGHPYLLIDGMWMEMEGTSNANIKYGDVYLPTDNQGLSDYKQRKDYSEHSPLGVKISLISTSHLYQDSSAVEPGKKRVALPDSLRNKVLSKSYDLRIKVDDKDNKTFQLILNDTVLCPQKYLFFSDSISLTQVFQASLDSLSLAQVYSIENWVRDYKIDSLESVKKNSSSNVLPLPKRIIVVPENHVPTFVDSLEVVFEEARTMPYTPAPEPSFWNRNMILILVGASVLLILIIGGVFFFWKRRPNGGKVDPSDSEEDKPEPTTTPSTQNLTFTDLVNQMETKLDQLKPQTNIGKSKKNKNNGSKAQEVSVFESLKQILSTLSEMHESEKNEAAIKAKAAIQSQLELKTQSELELRKSNRDLEKEVKELKSSKNQSEVEVARLKAQLNAVENLPTDEESSRAKILELEGQLGAKESTIESLRDELKEQIDAFLEKIKENERLLEEIKRLKTPAPHPDKDVVKQLIESLKQAQDDKATVEQQLKQAQEEKANVEQQLKTERDNRASEKQNLMNQLEQAKQDTKQKVDEAREAEKQKSKKEIDKLKDENSNLKSNLEKEKQEGKQRVTKAREEEQQKAESKISGLQTQLDSTRSTLNDTQKVLKVTTQTLKDCTEKCEQHEKEIERLNEAQKEYSERISFVPFATAYAQNVQHLLSIADQINADAAKLTKLDLDDPYMIFKAISRFTMALSDINMENLTTDVQMAATTGMSFSNTGITNLLTVDSKQQQSSLRNYFLSTYLEKYINAVMVYNESLAGIHRLCPGVTEKDTAVFVKYREDLKACFKQLSITVVSVKLFDTLGDNLDLKATMVDFDSSLPADSIIEIQNCLVYPEGGRRPQDKIYVKAQK